MSCGVKFIRMNKEEMDFFEQTAIEIIVQRHVFVIKACLKGF